MDIETAREMLAAATAEEPPACQCPGLVGHGRPTHENPCAWFDTMHSRGMARRKIGELGFTPATLVALILAVEALGAEKKARLATGWQSTCNQQVHGDSHIQCGECFICLERKALAAWRAL